MLNLHVICSLQWCIDHSDFLKDFSEFLFDIVTRSENLLIVGDFNIHLCCPSKPLVKEFVHLIDSFNLMQSVSVPTHKLGHTLDIVLSSGFSIKDIDVRDSGLSDHWPVVFDSDITSCNSVYQPSTFLARPLNSSTSMHFKELFLVSAADSTTLASQGLDVEDMVSNFNASCLEVLNTVAPLKVKKTKQNKQPWLNDDIKALRKICRRAERKWKRDKLQISYQLLQASLSQYQEAVSL